MTDSNFLPILGVPFTWSAPLTLIFYLLVSPGLPAIMALVIERRRLVPRNEFWALAYGDPFLAVMAATSVLLCQGEVPSAVIAWVNAPYAWLVPLAAVAFGLWQWFHEYQSGFYTAQQALSPTKIYHQVLIYPVLGYAIWVALISGLAAPTPNAWAWAAKTMILLCYLVWLGLHLYDRRHPKLGHVPFDWSTFRPFPEPWLGDSESLRAARQQQRR